MRHFLFSMFLLALAVSSNAETETNRFILPYSVHGAVFDPVKPRAFVFPHDRSAVDLIDLDSRARESYGLGGSPRSMALSPDGKRLYVAIGKTQNSGTVAIFDAQEFEFLRQIEVAISPSDIVATDSGLIIISSDRSPSYVRVFESEHGNQVGTSSEVPPHLDLALNPVLGFVYASGPAPDGVHRHLSLSPSGAITSQWQVPFHERTYSDNLFVFPEGSRALSGSGHVLTSTTNMQTDLQLLADTGVNPVYAAAFETNQNRIVLRTEDRVHFVDAETLQQIESRRIPFVEFIGAYHERTAAIGMAPLAGGSEIRWLLPKPASASENLAPTALWGSYEPSTVFPVDSLLPIAVLPRDADSEITSTRIFSGTNQISIRSEALIYQDVRIRPGTNEIYAVVTDTFGSTGTSVVHRVYGNYPPQLTVSPVPTSYTNVQPVRIQAQATDQDGVIKTVRLLLGTQVIAQDDTAPYELLFVPPIPGNYSLQLQAEDNHGTTTELFLAFVFQGGTDNYQQGMTVQPSGATNLLLYGSNVNATSQKGEPLHAGVEGGKSIWWAWRVPNLPGSKGGIVSIDTIGSDFDTLLAVYSAVPAGTNDISKLTLLAANDDDITDAPASRVKFFATPSDILYIAVDGREGVSGNVKLRINFQSVPRPLNDNFLAATSTTTGGTGSNVGASKEPGELDHAGNSGGASVWWKLAVGSADLAPIQISTSASRFDTLLAVYTTNFPPRVINATITNLTLIAANDDHLGGRTSELTFTPVKPGNYWIAVDGYNGAEGMITLAISSNPAGAPANDHFASASLLSGTSLLTNGNTLKATLQPGEPIHAGKTNSASVWFKWTAPTNGLVSISTRTSDFDTILAIYKGTNLTTLTPVAANDDDPEAPPSSALRFFASQGTEYFIAVAGYANARGEFVLAINQSGGFSPRLEAEWLQGKIVLDAIDTSGTTLLETSPNLVDWEIVGIITPSEPFNIAPSPDTPQHFYRLRLQE